MRRRRSSVISPNADCVLAKLVASSNTSRSVLCPSMILEYSASETFSCLLKHAAVSGASRPARKAVFVTSTSAFASIDGGIESGRGGISH
ncbi:hypothetical protein D3C80_1400370 [compost metagenome]